MAKRKFKSKNYKKSYKEENYEELSPIRRLERKLDRVNHIMELISYNCSYNVVGIKLYNFSKNI